MGKLDPILLTIVSELFINLSAGWLGAAFIVPVTSQASKKVNLRLLTINILSAIFSLTLAFKLSKLAGQ